ncbi:carboxypeptidase-like regulatory domain-containing protein [Sphingobacterium sp. Mn56C]|uniref:carboxypeptidase-like regulatory domain-containing protein n=1 Tax=Sphingobacterium sp. Mn56C TaxID=3395261 RepID=UPI003BE3D16C
MRNQLLILFFSTFLFQEVYSQTTISGKVVDDDHKPIPNVSVSYKKVGGAAMLGFGRSDNNGLYSFLIKITDVDSVQLDFQHMNYAKKSVVVANRTANYSYQPRHQAREIEEVKVGNLPIYKRKDTINYALEPEAL